MSTVTAAGAATLHTTCDWRIVPILHKSVSLASGNFYTSGTSALGKELRPAPGMIASSVNTPTSNASDGRGQSNENAIRRRDVPLNPPRSRLLSDCVSQGQSALAVHGSPLASPPTPKYYHKKQRISPCAAADKAVASRTKSKEYNNNYPHHSSSSIEHNFSGNTNGMTASASSGSALSPHKTRASNTPTIFSESPFSSPISQATKSSLYHQDKQVAANKRLINHFYSSAAPPNGKSDKPSPSRVRRRRFDGHAKFVNTHSKNNTALTNPLRSPISPETSASSMSSLPIGCTNYDGTQTGHQMMAPVKPHGHNSSLPGVENDSRKTSNRQIAKSSNDISLCASLENELKTAMNRSGASEAAIVKPTSTSTFVKLGHGCREIRTASNENAVTENCSDSISVNRNSDECKGFRGEAHTRAELEGSGVECKVPNGSGTTSTKAENNALYTIVQDSFGFNQTSNTCLRQGSAVECQGLLANCVRTAIPGGDDMTNGPECLTLADPDCYNGTTSDSRFKGHILDDPKRENDGSAFCNLEASGTPCGQSFHYVDSSDGQPRGDDVLKRETQTGEDWSTNNDRHYFSAVGNSLFPPTFNVHESSGLGSYQGDLDVGFGELLDDTFEGSDSSDCCRIVLPRPYLPQFDLLDLKGGDSHVPSSDSSIYGNDEQRYWGVSNANCRLATSNSSSFVHYKNCVLTTENRPSLPLAVSHSTQQYALGQETLGPVEDGAMLDVKTANFCEINCDPSKRAIDNSHLGRFVIFCKAALGLDAAVNSVSFGEYNETSMAMDSSGNEVETCVNGKSSSQLQNNKTFTSSPDVAGNEIGGIVGICSDSGSRERMPREDFTSSSYSKKVNCLDDEIFREKCHAGEVFDGIDSVRPTIPPSNTCFPAIRIPNETNDFANSSREHVVEYNARSEVAEGRWFSHNDKLVPGNDVSTHGDACENQPHHFYGRSALLEGRTCDDSRINDGAAEMQDNSAFALYDRGRGGFEAERAKNGAVMNSKESKVTTELALEVLMSGSVVTECPADNTPNGNSERLKFNRDSDFPVSLDVRKNYEANSPGVSPPVIPQIIFTGAGCKRMSGRPRGAESFLDGVKFGLVDCFNSVNKTGDISWDCLGIDAEAKSNAAYMESVDMCGDVGVMANEENAWLNQNETFSITDLQKDTTTAELQPAGVMEPVGAASEASSTGKLQIASVAQEDISVGCQTAVGFILQPQMSRPPQSDGECQRTISHNQVSSVVEPSHKSYANSCCGRSFEANCEVVIFADGVADSRRDMDLGNPECWGSTSLDAITFGSHHTTPNSCVKTTSKDNPSELSASPQINDVLAIGPSSATVVRKSSEGSRCPQVSPPLGHCSVTMSCSMSLSPEMAAQIFPITPSLTNRTATTATTDTTPTCESQSIQHQKGHTKVAHEASIISDEGFLTTSGAEIGGNTSESMTTTTTHAHYESDASGSSPFGISPQGNHPPGLSPHTRASHRTNAVESVFMASDSNPSHTPGREDDQVCQNGKSAAPCVPSEHVVSEHYAEHISPAYYPQPTAPLASVESGKGSIGKLDLTVHHANEFDFKDARNIGDGLEYNSRTEAAATRESYLVDILQQSSCEADDPKLLLQLLLSRQRDDGQYEQEGTTDNISNKFDSDRKAAGSISQDLASDTLNNTISCVRGVTSVSNTAIASDTTHTVADSNQPCSVYPVAIQTFPAMTIEAIGSECTVEGPQVASGQQPTQVQQGDATQLHLLNASVASSPSQTSSDNESLPHINKEIFVASSATQHTSPLAPNEPQTSWQQHCLPFENQSTLPSENYKSSDRTACNFACFNGGSCENSFTRYEAQNLIIPSVGQQMQSPSADCDAAYLGVRGDKCSGNNPTFQTSMMTFGNQDMPPASAIGKDRSKHRFEPETGFGRYMTARSMHHTTHTSSNAEQYSIPPPSQKSFATAKALEAQPATSPWLGSAAFSAQCDDISPFVSHSEKGQRMRQTIYSPNYPNNDNYNSRNDNTGAYVFKWERQNRRHRNPWDTTNTAAHPRWTYKTNRPSYYPDNSNQGYNYCSESNAWGRNGSGNCSSFRLNTHHNHCSAAYNAPNFRSVANQQTRNHTSYYGTGGAVNYTGKYNREQQDSRAAGHRPIQDQIIENRRMQTKLSNGSWMYRGNYSNANELGGSGVHMERDNAPNRRLGYNHTIGQMNSIRDRRSVNNSTPRLFGCYGERRPPWLTHMESGCSSGSSGVKSNNKAEDNTSFGFAPHGCQPPNWSPYYYNNAYNRNENRGIVQYGQRTNGVGRSNQNSYHPPSNGLHHRTYTGLDRRTGEAPTYKDSQQAANAQFQLAPQGLKPTNGVQTVSVNTQPTIKTSGNAVVIHHDDKVPDYSYPNYEQPFTSQLQSQLLPAKETPFPQPTLHQFPVQPQQQQQQPHIQHWVANASNCQFVPFASAAPPANCTQQLLPHTCWIAPSEKHWVPSDAALAFAATSSNSSPLPFCHPPNIFSESMSAVSTNQITSHKPFSAEMQVLPRPLLKSQTQLQNQNEQQLQNTSREYQLLLPHQIPHNIELLQPYVQYPEYNSPDSKRFVYTSDSLVSAPRQLTNPSTNFTSTDIAVTSVDIHPSMPNFIHSTDFRSHPLYSSTTTPAAIGNPPLQLLINKEPISSPNAEIYCDGGDLEGRPSAAPVSSIQSPNPPTTIFTFYNAPTAAPDQPNPNSVVYFGTLAAQNAVAPSDINRVENESKIFDANAML